ncbi:hypothetical protein NE237_004258 [Protea cynaroides]|uniref:Uncharacterized protein n=1 Tax=Protea cynaroides TaxID=273540 RepID=A0A9Q0QTI3_9MAGN|nr:hypothetical protein NE237_004258 [Protea cynaroides]
MWARVLAGSRCLEPTGHVLTFTVGPPTDTGYLTLTCFTMDGSFMVGSGVNSGSDKRDPGLDLRLQTVVQSFSICFVVADDQSRMGESWNLLVAKAMAMACESSLVDLRSQMVVSSGRRKDLFLAHGAIPAISLVDYFQAAVKSSLCSGGAGLPSTDPVAGKDGGEAKGDPSRVLKMSTVKGSATVSRLKPQGAEFEKDSKKRGDAKM